FHFFFLFFARLRIQGGFLTCIVVLLHIYALEIANVAVFLNELYIILIGMGIALLVNSIMPYLQPKIDAHKKHIESKYGKILYEYAVYLKDSERTWDEKEMIEVKEVIEEAKSIAILDVENHLLRKKNKDYYYL